MPHRPSHEKQWTVLELIRWGTEFFRQKDVDSPRLTMELLLCHVLGCSRIQLYSDFERPLLKEEREHLRGLVTRRAHHEPLQYITGIAEFYSLSFHVDPNVLIPRPETEHLVDAVISWAKGQPGRPLTCLDIGTGSGCIPITIAKHVETSEWTAVDRSEGALTVAEGNAATHGVIDRFRCLHLNFLTDIIEDRFDVITMNPPYIPMSEVPHLQEEVRDFEPHMALTDDANGLSFYERLAQQAEAILLPGGIMAVELGWGQEEQVRSIWPGDWSVTTIEDLSGIPRVLLIERPPVTNR